MEEDMKVKKLLAVLCTSLAFALCFAFAACNKEPEPALKTEYTVTFDANGGTLTGNATVKVKEGEKITNAPTAAKEEHDFSGWYTLATDGDKIEIATYTVSKDVTLYAHYTEKQVTPPEPSEKIEVTFDANGGEIEGANKIEVDEDGFIFDAPVPTRTGYRFDAWYSAAEGGETVDPMFDAITESTTLYAHWIKTYTVTFNAGEGTLAGAATLTVDENAKIVGAPEASKAGDEFHGWYTAAEGGDKLNLDEYVVTGDVTLYAHFGVITMPVKVLKSHEGAAVGYRIEAEAAKAEGTQNSDNQAHPGTFLEDTANASGGQSLGYLGTVGNKVTFTFNSATAGKAKLSLVASSANIQMDFSSGFVMWGADQPLTGREMTMTFNGASVTYEAVLVRGATKEEAIANGGFAFNFRWTSVPVCEVDVIAGVNTFVVTVADANVINMDCLDIETKLNITSANGDAASGEATLPAPPAPDVVYEKNVTIKFIVGGYAGGPAIEKAIIGFKDDIPATSVSDENNPIAISLGGKLGQGYNYGYGDKVYLSDANGSPVAAGTATSKYVTIQYSVGYSGWSFAGNLSPFVYSQQTSKNSWKDLTTAKLSLSGLKIGDTTYTEFGGTATVTKEVPCLTDWKLDGTFSETITWGTDNARQINLTYGAYEPAALKTDNGKNPLIVWLHGGGEGGTDPSIAILGNQVTGLSSETVQKYFKTNLLAGAYVLAPQTPTQWMDIGDGKQASAPENSVYTESLFKLIKEYAEKTNDDVDLNRIYIGGCSNGGWMTLELLADHGEYFAAAYPVSACYDTKYITDEMINKLKNIPIWFTHSAADGTLPIAEKKQEGWTTVFGDLLEQNTNELYIKLINAGAKNVYYSLFEKVSIYYNEYYSENYDGHWSWIYTLRDECKNVQTRTGTGTDGALTLADLKKTSTETVKLTPDGEAVTMWAWIAAQAKTPAQA